MTREALAAALGTALERHESLRGDAGTSFYAQVDIPLEPDSWSALIRWTETVGPKLSALRQSRLIGSASMDLAISFLEERASLSFVVPSHVAAAIGGYGIDLEFSIYLVGEDQ